jgi:hypothetical protein
MAEGAMGDWSAIYIRMDLGAAPATAAYGFAAFSLTRRSGASPVTGWWRALPRPGWSSRAR